jgi:hypothetical protein
MPLTAEQGYKIREEYSNVKEREVCDAHGLTQVGGSRTKVDGTDGVNNKSIKNMSGSSTQVHLTTQKHFIKMLNISGDSVKFIEHFCGNENYNYKGKDRRTIKQIDEQYVTAFKQFLYENKSQIIDLIIRNGYDITSVVIKITKTGDEYELTYSQICDKIKNAEWVFLRGGIHLKSSEGKSYFHFQREGKKSKSNRYNVLWHIHQNLFV